LPTRDWSFGDHTGSFSKSDKFLKTGQSPIMSQDLASHLQNLLGSSDQVPSESAKQAWTDLVNSWEAESSEDAEGLQEDEGDRPSYEPLPNLLDFYKPGPQALAFPRLDDELHDRHRDESHTRNGEPTALPVVSSTPLPSASGVEAALAQKIRRYAKPVIVWASHR
jgi:hypothetical protein